MPFLELNGYTIPTAQGGEVEIVEFGDRDPAFDGSSRRSIRAIKKRWAFSSTPQSITVTDALRSLVRGEGDLWTGVSDFYSSKGRPATSSVATRRSNTAADGDAVKFLGQTAQLIDEAKYASSFWVEPATTNILGADQRDAQEQQGR